MLYLRKVIAVLMAFIAQQAAEDKNFKPLDEITGTDTAIERQMAVMLTSEREFVQLWRAHKEILGDPPVNGNIRVEAAQIPKVDFKKNVVIAIFAGQSMGIDGYTVVDVDTKGKTNRVIVRARPFPGGLISSSYAMWVFPRPHRTTELEILTGMRDGKPVTSKIAKFEPPKEPKVSKAG